MLRFWKNTDCVLHSWIFKGAGTDIAKPSATARSAGAYTSTTTTKASASINAGRAAPNLNVPQHFSIKNYAEDKINPPPKCVDFGTWVTFSNGTKIGGPLTLEECSNSPSQRFTYNKVSRTIMGMCRTFAPACLCRCLVCVSVTGPPVLLFSEFK